MDLHGHPEIKPRVDLVTDLVRATTIQQGPTPRSTRSSTCSAPSAAAASTISPSK
ncbi:MAG: hypothetical protein WDM96_01790 [Lacunisphaera sp.]